MTENEDHRQKNVQLAKKLNEVKENLRKCREENIALEKKYKSSQMEVTNSKNEKKAILNSVFQFKHQLDKIFVHHPTGYFQSSQQFDQILSKLSPKSIIHANGLNKSSTIELNVELFSGAKQLDINDDKKVPVNSDRQLIQVVTSNGLAESSEATLRCKPKAKHKRNSLRKNVLKKSVWPISKKPNPKGFKAKSKCSSSEDSKDGNALVLRSGRNIIKK